jgi:hypothetical protein
MEHLWCRHFAANDHGPPRTKAHRGDTGLEKPNHGFCRAGSAFTRDFAICAMPDGTITEDRPDQAHSKLNTRSEATISAARRCAGMPRN